MKNYVITIATLGIGIFLLVFAMPSYADRIVHVSSGKCIHPKGRPIHPYNNVRLVLHSGDCSYPDFHLEFVLKNNHIVHVASGKCIHPYKGRNNPGNNTKLVLYDGCSDDRTKFVQLPGGQIQHVNSGRCIVPRLESLAAPKNSSALTVFVSNDTGLVLYDKCNEDYAKFSLRKVEQSEATTKLYHSNSGRCVHIKGRPIYPSNNTPLVFHSDDCSTPDDRLYFTLQSNGTIKHVNSKRCIHPKGDANDPGNDTQLVLLNDCTKYNAQFRQLPSGAIQHKSSGKCIHPYRGSRNPSDNTPLVLYDGCRGDKVRMHFQ